MVHREVESTLFSLMQKYPAINVTGPRQSGKTTLVRELLKEHRYFSLENPDIQLFAEEDPRGFLRSAGKPSYFRDTNILIKGGHILSNYMTPKSAKL